MHFLLPVCVVLVSSDVSVIKLIYIWNQEEKIAFCLSDKWKKVFYSVSFRNREAHFWRANIKRKNNVRNNSKLNSEWNLVNVKRKFKDSNFVAWTWKQPLRWRIQTRGPFNSSSAAFHHITWSSSADFKNQNQPSSQHGWKVLKVLRRNENLNMYFYSWVNPRRSCDMTESSGRAAKWTLWWNHMTHRVKTDRQRVNSQKLIFIFCCCSEPHREISRFDHVFFIFNFWQEWFSILIRLCYHGDEPLSISLFYRDPID